MSDSPNRNSRHWPELLLAAGYLLAVGYSVYGTWSTGYRYNMYFDQVIFEQALRSFWQGKDFYAPWEFDILQFQATSHTAAHFQPILAFIAPIYALWPYTLTTKVVEALLMYSGCFPLFWLARKVLGGVWVPLGIAAIFLMDWTAMVRIWTEFHPVNFVTGFWLWVMWFVFSRKLAGVLLMTIACLMVKETETLTGLFLGVWCLAQRKYRAAGMGIVALSVAWAILAFFIIIPSYTDDGEYHFSHYYGERDEALLDVLWEMVRQPEELIGRVNTRENRRLVPEVFQRFLAVPLFAPLYLFPAVPSAAAAMLSEMDFHKIVWERYLSAVWPFLYVSLVFGVHRLGRWFGAVLSREPQWVYQRVVVLLLVCNVVNLDGSTFFRTVPDTGWAFDPEIDARIREVMKDVPPGIPVSASNYFARYLLHTHEELYCFPWWENPVDEFLFAVREPMSQERKAKLLRLMEMGFLPQHELWREIVYRLRREESPAARDFLEQLRLETEKGFSFTDPEDNAIRSMFAGFSNFGSSGSWSLGYFQRVLFFYNEHGGPLWVTIKARHPKNYIENQKLTLQVNNFMFYDQKVIDWQLDLTVELPCEVLHEGPNTLSMFLDEYFIPIEIGLHNDARKLGLKYESIHFHELPPREESQAGSEEAF